jgi:selina-4(15),7(11)-diene synthase
MSPTPSLIVPRTLDGLLPSRLATFAALQCPFSLTRNVNEAEAGNQARVWLVDRFGDSKATRKLMAADMERFTAGFYPSTSLAGLTWATRFLFWAFVLDDLVDETDVGRGATSTALLIERLDLVLQRRPLPDASVLETSLAELLTDLLPFLQPGEYEEFCDACRAYFGALVWEANNRASNWIPDLTSFELFRPAAGAVPPFWMLIGPLEQLRLDADTSAHVELQKAQSLAGRIACWYNDVLSYEKEYAAHDVHNLAIVLERHRYLGAAEAFQAAVDFCNEDVFAFCTAAAALIADAPSDVTRRYLAVLESMMATTLTWTLESARYGNTSSEVPRLGIQFKSR